MRLLVHPTSSLLLIIILPALVWTGACIRPVQSQSTATGTADGTYASRQAEILAIGNSKQIGPVVQAYNDDPIDETVLDELLLDLDQDRDAAFRIIVLIRTHEFTKDDTVRETIYNTLKTIPFWLTPGEDTRVYWTENQMSMWMSSAYLLQQRYPNDTALEVGDTLRQRLVHYLSLKLKYGFSEFFSSVYLPYTLSGLLNLVDFCEDEEIQGLAEKVTLKLIDHILMATTSEGAFFATAGRNYGDYYLGSFTQIAETIWLLTGVGTKPTRIRQATGFLATSKLNWSGPTAAVTNNKNVTNTTATAVVGGNGTAIRFPIRPSLQDSFAINDDLDRVDRVMFQWAMGAYFHPDVIDDTLWLLGQYNLSNHGEFSRGIGGSLTPFLNSSLTGVLGGVASNVLKAVTAGSVLTGSDVILYRNHGVVLSSVQDFHQGIVGYQSYPWMATTGTLAIWTQSGPVIDDWSDRPSFPSNTHLPYVEQVKNVALIMYDPANDLALIQQFIPDGPFSPNDTSVALRWPGDEFTSQVEFGNWLCGEEALPRTDAGTSKSSSSSYGYICVSRPCLNTTDVGIPACSGDEQQLWAAIVGTDDMYGTFDEFTQKVQDEAVVKTEWRSTGEWWCLWCGKVFYGEVRFDGIVIAHELQED